MNFISNLYMFYWNFWSGALGRVEGGLHYTGFGNGLGLACKVLNFGYVTSISRMQ